MSPAELLDNRTLQSIGRLGMDDVRRLGLRSGDLITGQAEERGGKRIVVAVNEGPKKTPRGSPPSSVAQADRVDSTSSSVSCAALKSPPWLAIEPERMKAPAKAKPIRVPKVATPNVGTKAAKPAKTAKTEPPKAEQVPRAGGGPTFSSTPTPRPRSSPRSWGTSGTNRPGSW